ncbi:MAG: PAS domain S-box protein [Acidobacteria bacterium]|nr:PAS domain S-box protein [Acidobacteriota bacterium]
MIRLVHLDDSSIDQELIAQELKREGLEFTCRHASDRESLIQALDAFDPDVILSDFTLASFTGFEVLSIARDHRPDTPLIFVSGALGEERAVDLLKQGASDCILKDRLQRLVPAVKRAKQEADSRRGQRKAEEVRRHHEQLERLINQFSVDFVNARYSSIDDAITRSIAELGALIDADGIYLYMTQDNRPGVVKSHAWLREGTKPRVFERPIDITRFPQVADLLSQLKTVYIRGEDTVLSQSPDVAEFFTGQEDVERLLLAPIAPFGEMIGFLGCESKFRSGHWTEETTTLLRAAGEVFGSALLRVRSDRALRTEREFLKKVLDFSGALIVVFDEKGRFTRVNEVFTQTTGYTENEVVGRSIFELIVTDEYERQVPRDLMVVLRAGGFEILERPILTKSGERREVRWKVDLLRNGSDVQIVATGIDLTDLKQAEVRRGLLEAQLEQSQRIESLGRVAANVAHEFNNVLMGIQPFADVVARTAGDDQRLKMCSDQISRAIQRGSRITREVLRFAHPTEPAREIVRTGEWMRNLVEESRMLIGDQMQIAVSIGQDCEISIDRSQLEQVIVNLLLNARDAMHGEGRVDIMIAPTTEVGRYSFGLVPEPERHVHIQLRDQGPGVPEEIRERLFEPFFTTKPKGTGLGLAVSHQIIRAHGGHMFVDSEEGEGATFHIFLPRTDLARADESAQVTRQR